jgi:hypothetical protein
MWRIYMDNEEDRLSLLVQGLVLRDRQIPLHSQHPYNPCRAQPDTIRIKVKNVPLSADDGQIHRALTLAGCEIQVKWMKICISKLQTYISILTLIEIVYHVYFLFSEYALHWFSRVLFIATQREIMSLTELMT